MLKAPFWTSLGSFKAITYVSQSAQSTSKLEDSHHLTIYDVHYSDSEDEDHDMPPVSNVDDVGATIAYE